MTLEPSLWGTLPKELLDLVFAHLPLTRIGELRVLSKEWKRNIDCKDSEFNHVVFNATAHLNMFALLSWKHLDRTSNSSNIHEVQANKWHNYESSKVPPLDGADGGLVFYVSQWMWSGNNPQFCIVMNPLMKQRRMQLPPLMSIEAEKSNSLVTMIRMVKLIVDKKTKEYQVFVIGFIANDGQGFFAQVYDSHIKEWTTIEATHSRIIGWDYMGFQLDFPSLPILCMYNCANRTLQHFYNNNFAPRLSLKPSGYVLLEDHLFVLHKEASNLGFADQLGHGANRLPKYCISEFHLPEKSTTWVKLKVHNCRPYKCVYDKPYSFENSRLWGCNGFLFVYGHGSKHAWLYNLSTCEWHTFPPFGRSLYLKMMCTISWSVIV